MKHDHVYNACRKMILSTQDFLWSKRTQKVHGSDISRDNAYFAVDFDGCLQSYSPNSDEIPYYNIP